MSNYAELSIGDVAKITGLPSHTIRYWEKEFSLYLAPDRTIGKQRRYSEKDIQDLDEIRHLLKVEGFSIAGAKRQLSKKLPKQEEPNAPASENTQSASTDTSIRAMGTAEEKTSILQGLYNL